MKYFCSMPFTEMFINGNNARPCCNFKGAIPYNSYFTDPVLREVKKQLLNDVFPDQCSACKLSEEKSGYSFRTIGNQFRFPDDIENYTEDYFNIKHLQITTSNICNLLCLPCNDFGSYIRGVELNNLKLSLVPAKVIVDNNLSRFLSLDFDELTVLGGEPFSDKVTFNFLEELVNTGKSVNIRINLNTNLTLITQEKLNFLANNFKRVYIKGSIDGVSEVNEYLRYPSTWNNITSVVDMIRSTDNIEFAITTALSNLALLQYHKLFAWANENSILDRFISPVQGPYQLACYLLPLSIKADLLPVYENLKKELEANTSNRSIETINACIGICQDHTDYSQQFSQSLKWLKKHDEHRGTNLYTVFPELQRYII